jgi:nucleoside-diphosphate kinase
MYLVGCKQLYLTEKQIQKHYPQHVGKGFFPQLVDFMTSGPVLACVFEGPDACRAVRQLIGGTKHPSDAPPGSIRGRFAQTFPMNLIHGSDEPGEAEREISLYFNSDEIFDLKFIQERQAEITARRKKEREEFEAMLSEPLVSGSPVQVPFKLTEGDVVMYQPMMKEMYVHESITVPKGQILILQPVDVAAMPNAIFSASFDKNNWLAHQWLYVGKLDKAPTLPSTDYFSNAHYNASTWGIGNPWPISGGVMKKLAAKLNEQKQVMTHA